MFNSKLLRPAVVLTLAALMSSCATGPAIQRDTNPAALFPTYKTFGYFTPLATDRAGYESVFTTRLKDATRRAMEAKGYVYTERSPELLLNFYANVQNRQEIRTTPAPGYYGYRRGYYGGFGATQIETVTYREGTLTVDLIEAQRKLLVWQATAEGSVSEEARKNPGAAIDTVVAKLMEPLPAPARP